MPGTIFWDYLWIYLLKPWPTGSWQDSHRSLTLAVQ